MKYKPVFEVCRLFISVMISFVSYGLNSHFLLLFSLLHREVTVSLSGQAGGDHGPK